MKVSFEKYYGGEALKGEHNFKAHSMYNSVNPAIIKSILGGMKKPDLLKEILFIQQELESLEKGNKRNMMLRLHQFATNQYNFL
jgi:hypothetical protein